MSLSRRLTAILKARSWHHQAITYEPHRTDRGRRVRRAKLATCGTASRALGRPADQNCDMLKVDAPPWCEKPVSGRRELFPRSRRRRAATGNVLGIDATLSAPAAKLSSRAFTILTALRWYGAPR